MKGELEINGKDAYLTWGIYLGQDSISALITPAPNKEYISNKSREEHGKSVITSNVKVDERDIQLQMYIQAKNRNDFFCNLSSISKDVFEKGEVNIRTKYQPNVIYHCVYLSCQQFCEYNGRLGKFILKLNEPNPKNRT